MPAADKPEHDATTNDASHPLVGKDVGKYKIVRVIARGGMGTVYEALNTSIGKRVAMKFVDAELARNKDAVLRFQREAEAASAVESAHIVTIFDSGVSEFGLPYLVMELLRGEDLGRRIKSEGRLELEEALPLIAQLLRGLHRAHEAGIVHRDLKPDNVFLSQRDDEERFVKILDFGISKVRRTEGVPEKSITREGTVLGTPFYMSPEQSQALPDVDERTDLWSVGAILYECLTGRSPHDGQNYEQVIVNICTKDAPDARVYNPAVPEPLARVIGKALSRDKEARYASAKEMLEALGEASDGLLSAKAIKISSTANGGTARGSMPSMREAEASGPAMEVGTNGPSRVGWSRASASNQGKDRLRMFVVLGAALAVGLGVLIFLKRAPSEASATSTSRASGGAVVEPRPEPRGEPANATPPGMDRPDEPTPNTNTSAETTTAPPTSGTHSKKPGTPKVTTTTKPIETAKPQASPQAGETGGKGVAPQLKIKTE